MAAGQPALGPRGPPRASIGLESAAPEPWVLRVRYALLRDNKSFSLNRGTSCAALSLGDRVTPHAGRRGFGRMGEDGRVPPLSRRVPGATDRERPKPVPRVPPRRLPDSLLQRMQAAIDASPERAVEQEKAACPQLPEALPRPGPGVSDGRKPQARPVPSAVFAGEHPKPGG